MRCLSFFGHPCLCLQIPSFQGLGGIFTRWILAMPGTLRFASPKLAFGQLRIFAGRSIQEYYLAKDDRPGETGRQLITQRNSGFLQPQSMGGNQN